MTRSTYSHTSPHQPTGDPRRVAVQSQLRQHRPCRTSMGSSRRDSGGGSRSSRVDGGSTNTRCCRLTTTGTHLNSVGRATVVDVGGPSRPFGSLQGCCRRLLAHSSSSVQEGNYSGHGKIRQVHCRRDRKHSPHTSDQTAGSPTPPARVAPRRSLRLAERTLSRPAQLRFLTMPTHRVARRAARGHPSQAQRRSVIGTPVHRRLEKMILLAFNKFSWSIGHAVGRECQGTRRL